MREELNSVHLHLRAVDHELKRFRRPLKSHENVLEEVVCNELHKKTISKFDRKKVLLYNNDVTLENNYINHCVLFIVNSHDKDHEKS